MSTVPGDGTWRDAGLEPVDPFTPRRLTDADETEPDAEEYAPGFPRADREGGAAEADVVEQDTEVGADDEPDEI